MRRSTENARGMFSHGSTALTTPFVAFCFGSASLTSELSTTTVSGHSCSVPGWRGHHGKLSRARRHEHVPATALLPITSAFRSSVMPSLAVMTALAMFTAASDGKMSAGGLGVGGAVTVQSRRSRLTTGCRVGRTPAAAAARSSSSSSSLSLSSIPARGSSRIASSAPLPPRPATAAEEARGARGRAPAGGGSSSTSPSTMAAAAACAMAS